MNNKIISGIIGTFIVIVLGICMYEIIIADKTGPVISYSDEDITYTEGQDDSVLLEGVRAKDSRDGDVSNSIIVAEKIVTGSRESMKIVYAAKDKKHNITRKSRIVKYIATGKTQGGSGNESGDAENKSTENTSEEPDTIANTGSTGEIDKAAANASGIPVIKLTAAEATIKVGQTFDEISYVKETYDNSGDVSRRIRIDGTYDIAVPGDYKFNYLVSDTEGNISEPAPFTLHIVAAENNTQSTANTQQETTKAAE